jgi:hypothetical protein
MDEDAFNLGIRKFLKTFGVSAQREIERAVREAIESGALAPDSKVGVRATLAFETLEGGLDVEDEIPLE